MWRDDALEHAIKEDPRESCGLLIIKKGKEVYFPCKNLAFDPKDQFIIDADANNDNKIIARELHAYVEQNVVQQSSGSQTPELQGDKDRVLVQFN